jgi:hypothetical protein
MQYKTKIFLNKAKYFSLINHPDSFKLYLNIAVEMKVRYLKKLSAECISIIYDYIAITKDSKLELKYQKFINDLNSTDFELQIEILQI